MRVRKLSRKSSIGGRSSQPGRGISALQHLDALEGRVLMSAAPAIEVVAASPNSSVVAPRLTYYVATPYLVNGQDGQYAIVNPTKNTVRWVAADGAVTEWSLPADIAGWQLAGPHGAMAPGGSLWLPLVAGDQWRIVQMNATGQELLTSPTESAAGDSGPVLSSDVPEAFSVAADTLGGCWYAHGSNEILHLAGDGQVLRFTVPGIGSISELAIASDGGVWFGGGLASAASTGAVGHLATGGDISFTTQSLDFVPGELAEATSGWLYFAGGKHAGWFSPLGVKHETTLKNADLHSLTAGPDGHYWLVDQDTTRNPLVRINDDASMTRMAVAGVTTGLDALALVPAPATGGALRYLCPDGVTVGTINVVDALIGQSKRVAAVYGKPFSEIVGSFFDPSGNQDASAYQATIEWGDGVVFDATIVANTAGGFDVIAGGPTQWGEYKGTITVTELDAASPRTLTIPSSLTVMAPALAGKAVAVAATAGQQFSGTVARYIGVATDMLDRYHILINWGDGESGSGQLIAVDSQTVKVVGQHTYLKPGFYDLSVTISERTIFATPWFQGGLVVTPTGSSMRMLPPGSSSTAYGRVSVGDGFMVGDIVIQNAVTGQRVTRAVARFQWSAGDEGIENYRAVIDWGTCAQGAAEGVLEATAAGFVVRGQAVYTAPGYAQVSVRIYDTRLSADAGTIGLAKGAFHVQSHLQVTANAIHATAGVRFSGKVGEIVSPGSGTLWQSTVTATIDWGDGATSEGQVIPNASGGWDVTGHHTYQVTGDDRSLYFGITVTEVRTPLVAGLPDGPFTYQAHNSNYPTATVAAGIFDGFTLTAAQSYLPLGPAREITVGRIILGNPQTTIDDLQATLTWEDGSTSQVRFVASGAGARHYSIIVTYAATEGGNHSGQLTVTLGDSQQTVTTRVYVTTPATPSVPLASVSAGSIDAIKGVSWTGIVGSFKPTDPGDDATQYAVTIGWGDGTSSAGTIEQGADGWYRIKGSHTYRRVIDQGTLYINLQSGGRYAGDSGSVDVTLDPTRLNADGKYLQFMQREEFTTVVASFTSPDADATPDQFTAWIEWGDGQRSRGVVTSRYDGTFDVSGTVTYHCSGTQHISVTISGPGGTDVAESTVYLDRNPVVVDPDTVLQVNGLDVSGRLAVFTDDDTQTVDTETTRLLHAGLVDWGDGEISWGVISQREDGAYEVQGSHHYAQGGDYKLKLVVRQTRRQLPSDARYHYSGRVYLSGTTQTNDAAVVIADTTDVMDFEKVLCILHIDSVAKPSLLVRGTSGDDTIFIRQRGDNVIVSGLPGGRRHFAADQIGTLQILSLSGNDRIEADSSVTVPLSLLGGAGNDTVIGGTGDDSLVGGRGDDWLYGRGGQDNLAGGRGRNYAYGGNGDDLLDARSATAYSFWGGRGRDQVKFDRLWDQLHGVEELLTSSR